MFNCTVPGAIAAISAATHGRFHWSPSQSASCQIIFLYDQKSRSSWSAMYSPHPRHTWHHKNRESCTAFSISILHLPTFPSLLLLSRQCKGPEKNFCEVLTRRG
jgi:hypothetical protein